MMINLHDTEVKFAGSLKLGEEKTFSQIAEWDVKFNKIICLRGLLLNLIGIKLANEEQLAISPILLQLFAPVAFQPIVDFSIVRKGQVISLTLYNPTDEEIWFKIKLLGVRRVD